MSDRVEIYQRSACDLLTALDNGDVTSVEIVESLIGRRKAVDSRINSWVLTRDDDLRREAAEADAQRARGELRGPLHGLPLSIKENIDVKGTASTLGMQSRKNAIATTNAVLVDTLLNAGALFLGKTNVPQLLLAQECENSLFGTTSNPWKLTHVPGGSSGGEAAAIASGSSVMGIGTDIGGSIRIPAHFCGIAGLKPTVDRWSVRGSSTAIAGQEVVRAQIGCMAREAADLSKLWQIVDPREMSARDPGVPPLPPGDPAAVDLTGLRIGWFDDDPFLAPNAAIRRGVNEAVAALEAAGATVVRHRPVESDEIFFLWIGALSADGGRTLSAAIGSEPPSPQLKPTVMMAKLPRPARRAASLLAGRVGERRIARLLDSLGEKGVDRYWQLTAERTQLRLAELDAWNRAELDAVICPPHVTPALPHRESADFTLSIAAMFRWALLNFPAGVVPVTTQLEAETGNYPTPSDKVEKKAAAMDAQGAGLPIGVQVVARPYREDVVLAVMEAVQRGVRADPNYPRTPVDPRK